MEEERAANFLWWLYVGVAFRTSYDTTDWIFGQIDRMLWDGEFSLIDRILREEDMTRLNTFALRSLACITYPAKDKLPSRDDYYRRAYVETAPRRGPQAAHDSLQYLY